MATPGFVSSNFGACQPKVEVLLLTRHHQPPRDDAAFVDFVWADGPRQDLWEADHSVCQGSFTQGNPGAIKSLWGSTLRSAA